MATRAAIWARVSTHDQHTTNQLAVLRQWAADRGLEVVTEYVTEDSAWTRSGNGKGAEYDRKRAQLVEGARMGRYSVVLVWAVDRLSRRGYKDLSGVLDQLGRHGCEVWSHQEQWLQTVGPFGEIVLHVLAWVAQQESQRRSERIKAGLARRRAAIEAGRIEGHVGGRKPGAKDRRKRDPEPYRQAWERRRESTESP